MDANTTMLIIFLCLNAGLALLLGFILGKTGFLNPDSGRLPKPVRILIGILLFGGLSIVFQISGVTYDGITLNARDVGPLVGGLWFSPVVGIGAGVVGAAFRLTAGGVTLIPCTIATLLAGVIAAGFAVWFMKTGRKMTILAAVLISVLVEVVHLTLVAIMLPNGLALALGPAGLGTLLTVNVTTFLFALTYCGVRRKKTA